jgi:hypothetical protein
MPTRRLSSNWWKRWGRRSERAKLPLKTAKSDARWLILSLQEQESLRRQKWTIWRIPARVEQVVLIFSPLASFF